MPWAEGAHAKLWPAALPLFLEDPGFGDRIPAEFHSAPTHNHPEIPRFSPFPVRLRGTLPPSPGSVPGERRSTQPASESLVRWSRLGRLAVLRLQNLIFSLQTFVVVLQGGVGAVKLLELAFQL